MPNGIDYHKRRPPSLSRRSFKEKIMKGAFIIVIVVTLLIVGILVIKNYNTGVAEGTAIKRDAIDVSKELAEKANRAVEKIRDLSKQLTGSD